MTDRPAILDRLDGFVVVPVTGTVLMHQAWYHARNAIIGGYDIDKGPYEALLAVRPEPNALAEIAAYVDGLEARLAEAEKVIEPLAVAAASYDPDESDGAGAAWAHDFTIGHLRAARAWMEGK